MEGVDGVAGLGPDLVGELQAADHRPVPEDVEDDRALGAPGIRRGELALGPLLEEISAHVDGVPCCTHIGPDGAGHFVKMIHNGKGSRSTIVSKGISAGHGQNTYRGLVTMHPRATNSRNYTQCDSLLIGDQCGAHTVPYIEVKNTSSRVEHEATTSKVDEDQLFYCRARGMDEEEAVALVVNGFCREVLQALPMEFAMEAQSLVAISLEGSVG